MYIPYIRIIYVKNAYPACCRQYTFKMYQEEQFSSRCDEMLRAATSKTMEPDMNCLESEVLFTDDTKRTAKY